jgi:hypothetical protein
VRLNQRAKIRNIDYDVAHAGGGETRDMPFDQCAAANFHQRFRHGVGQGSEALAATGGKYHGFHGMVRVTATRPIIECVKRATDVERPAFLALFARC